MRTAATKAMLELAPNAGPLGEIVNSVNENGSVSPRLLEQALTDAGYKVTHEEMKVRHKCIVENSDGEMVAQGVSDSPADALLQAIYAAIREEATIRKEAA